MAIVWSMLELAYLDRQASGYLEKYLSNITLAIEYRHRNAIFYKTQSAQVQIIKGGHDFLEINASSRRQAAPDGRVNCCLRTVWSMNHHTANTTAQWTQRHNYQIVIRSLLCRCSSSLEYRRPRSANRLILQCSLNCCSARLFPSKFVNLRLHVYRSKHTQSSQSCSKLTETIGNLGHSGLFVVTRLYSPVWWVGTRYYSVFLVLWTNKSSTISRRPFPSFPHFNFSNHSAVGRRTLSSVAVIQPPHLYMFNNW